MVDVYNDKVEDMMLVGDSNYPGVCNRPVPSLYELSYAALGGDRKHKHMAMDRCEKTRGLPKPNVIFTEIYK